MNVLSEQDDQEVLATLRAMGHPDPEGGLAEAKAQIAAALKAGLLELHSVNGELGVMVSDAKRLWPEYKEHDAAGR